MEASRHFGIPDIDLPRPGGACINPSHFAGHGLVVLFCPSDNVSAARELAAFRASADKLSYDDAYMVAICPASAGEPAGRMLLANDTKGEAWKYFSRCLAPADRARRDEGAVFLFGRGGCLARGWHGTGHAREVFEALGQRM